MTDTIALTGLVATEPKHVLTSEGLAITSFRLASTQRRFDKHEQKWVDADTNWYSVTAFRQLALNASTSVHKGERVIVSGRLKIRSWDTGEKSGTTIEIEADSIGHDLAWGASVFSRSMSSAALGRPATGDVPAGQTASPGGESASDLDTGSRSLASTDPTPF